MTLLGHVLRHCRRTADDGFLARIDYLMMATEVSVMRARPPVDTVFWAIRQNREPVHAFKGSLLSLN